MGVGGADWRKTCCLAGNDTYTITRGIISASTALSLRFLSGCFLAVGIAGHGHIISLDTLLSCCLCLNPSISADCFNHQTRSLILADYVVVYLDHGLDSPYHHDWRGRWFDMSKKHDLNLESLSPSALQSCYILPPKARSPQAQAPEKRAEVEKLGCQPVYMIPVPQTPDSRPRHVSGERKSPHIRADI